MSDGGETASIWPKVMRVFFFFGFAAIITLEFVNGTTWFPNVCTLTLWGFWLSTAYFTLAVINMPFNICPKTALFFWQVSFALSVPITLLFWTALFPLWPWADKNKDTNALIVL